METSNGIFNLYPYIATRVSAPTNINESYISVVRIGSNFLDEFHETEK